MGSDAIEPFVAAARAAGGGVLVLVRTSNPGAADIEDLQLADGGDACGSGSPRSSTSSGAAASARPASATWARSSARPRPAISRGRAS